MTRSIQLMRGLCATTALTALLVTAPVRLATGPDGAGPSLATNAAFARGGDDNGGSSGHGGGGERGGDDHGGSSGRGGGSDRGGDDHGGSSGRGGGDDRGGDDHGSSSGRGGGDDRGGDDHGGSSGRNDRGDDDHGGNSGRDGRDDVAGDDRGDGAPKVEIEGDKIEITFADGTRQEIENGRFEQKNAAGRTVIERPATAIDFEQLRAAAAGAGGGGLISGASVRSNGTKVEVSGRDIEITYADGWQEEINDDRYEMKDPNDNTVVERAVTSDDRSRLESVLND